MLHPGGGKGKNGKGEKVKGEDAKGAFCTACYTFVKRESLVEHLSICTRVAKGVRMVMPDKTETYKFKDHLNTEKTPFICLIDFESFLFNSEKKNTLPDHKLAAGFYLILNKSGKIVAWKFFLLPILIRRSNKCTNLLTLF